MCAVLSFCWRKWQALLRGDSAAFIVRCGVRVSSASVQDYVWMVGGGGVLRARVKGLLSALIDGSCSRLPLHPVRCLHLMVVWWTDCELACVLVEVCTGIWPHVAGVCVRCFATSPPMGFVGFASVFPPPDGVLLGVAWLGC